ncbi:unnamed protein product [Cunninghamella echinulata]
MAQPAIFRLQCNTQSYDWGKLGNESKVAQFASQSALSIQAHPDKELGACLLNLSLIFTR